MSETSKVEVSPLTHEQAVTLAEKLVKLGLAADNQVVTIHRIDPEPKSDARALLTVDGYCRCCINNECECVTEPDEEPPVEEHDPGPEVDDQGGMSEYPQLPGDPF